VYLFLVVLLLLAFIVLASVFGLLSLLKNWVDGHCQGEPVFHEQGPIFSDQGSEQRSRSQFAWQSRAHSREQD
jgi:hypothetical protein